MKKKSHIAQRIGVFLMLALILAHCQIEKKNRPAKQVEKISVTYCPPITLEGWERHEQAAFKGFMHAYNPCVVEVPDTEYPYRMWFFGWVSDIGNTDFAGMDAIYLARGKDLTTWEVYCKDGSWDSEQNNKKWASVLYSSTDHENRYFETFHSGDPSVVYKDGTFYMAYSATSNAFTDPDSPEPIEPPFFSNKAIPGYPSRMIQCVMGATSLDGIHWKKTEKPLLIAAVDNKYPPDPCPDRVGDFHRPSLMWDGSENKWVLYFDYYNAKVPGCNTGRSENTGDFLTGSFEFAHSLDKPLIINWPNPEVVKIGSCYFCFADPPGFTEATAPVGKMVDQGWQSRQLRMAKSDDGLIWEKTPYILPDSGIDASQIPQTLVTKTNGKWYLYLFYATQVGWRKGDVAYPFFKDDDYNWFYDEVRYMRQEIK